MRRKTAVAVAVALAGLAQTAQADGYARLSVGVQSTEDTTLELPGIFSTEADASVGPAGSLAVGWDPSGPLRFEAEFGASHSPVKVMGQKGDFVTLSGMLNGYLDLDLGWFVTPYVGAGAGGVLMFADHDTQDLAPAWQILGGLRFPVADGISLDLGYRFRRAEGGELGPLRVRGGVDSHTVQFGVVLGF